MNENEDYGQAGAWGHSAQRVHTNRMQSAFSGQIKTVDPAVASLYTMPSLAAVRAFRLVDHQHIIHDDGQLNPNRLPVEGVALTSSQVAQLHSAMNSPDVQSFPYVPLFPSYGFIFLDEKGGVLGGVSCELSFGGAWTDNRISIKNTDADILGALILELDLPVNVKKIGRSD